MSGLKENMNNITVRDIQESPFLSGISKVVAGRKGLDKSVKWVHIFEIKDVIEESTEPDIMILTTGMGFNEEKVALDYVNVLIKSGVSALCIETALYYHNISPKLIELADKNDFPIIEIPVISRFVDISRHANTMILEGNSSMYSRADRFEDKLNELETVGTLSDGIKYTAQYLNAEVAYMPVKGRTIASSKKSERWVGGMDALDRAFNKDGIYVKNKVAIKMVKIGDEKIGYLIFNTLSRDVDNFDTIILECLSRKIVSDTKHKIYELERKIFVGNSWVKEWIDGTISAKGIKKKAEGNIDLCKMKSIAVMNIKLKNYNFDESENSFSDEMHEHSKRLYLFNNLILKKILESEGIASIGYAKGNIISYVISSEDEKDAFIEKINRVIPIINDRMEAFPELKENIMAIGKISNNLEGVHRSYEMALKLLKDYEGESGKILVYDTSKMERIFGSIDDQILSDIVEDELKELIRPENYELYNTLKEYLKCNCNKQKAATELYVVRQTLYFRLQKIEEILGIGYDEGDRRFSLEFAVRINEYLRKAE